MNFTAKMGGGGAEKNHWTEEGILEISLRDQCKYNKRSKVQSLGKRGGTEKMPEKQRIENFSDLAKDKKKEIQEAQ